MSSLSKGIEPVTRAFLESLNAAKGPQIYEIPVEEGRAAFTRLQDVPVTKLPADIEDRTVPGGPTGQVGIRILRPRGSTQPLHPIVYTHGAGWVFGDKDIYDRLMRDLVNGAQAAVVFVDFSRSPEARYPVAIEQSYAVLKHVATNNSRRRGAKRRCRRAPLASSLTSRIEACGLPCARLRRSSRQARVCAVAGTSDRIEPCHPEAVR